MSGGVLANWPIALVVVLIIVGVPLWLTFRRRHLSPDYREARTHFRAKKNPGTAASTSDYVPSDRMVATDGLTVARSPLADPDEEPAESGTGTSGDRTRPGSSEAR
jgi:hypothetical protein